MTEKLIPPAPLGCETHWFYDVEEKDDFNKSHTIFKLCDATNKYCLAMNMKNHFVLHLISVIRYTVLF